MRRSIVVLVALGVAFAVAFGLAVWVAWVVDGPRSLPPEVAIGAGVFGSVLALGVAWSSLVHARGASVPGPRTARPPLRPKPA